MPRVFWMKMSCKKVFSMTYFIQINFIKNDLNKNVLNKKRRGRCFIAYVRFSLRIKNVILYRHASAEMRGKHKRKRGKRHENNRCNCRPWKPRKSKLQKSTTYRRSAALRVRKSFWHSRSWQMRFLSALRIRIMSGKRWWRWKKAIIS